LSWGGQIQVPVSDVGGAPERKRFDKMVVDQRAGLSRFVRSTGLEDHLVDDVTQASFLILLEALPRVVKGSERAFLYSTALRLVYGLRRRSRREVASCDLDVELSKTPALDDLVFQKWAREMLNSILMRIEGESRCVFVSFELEGCTIPEIATALSISPAIAVCRLRRARRRFRTLVRHFRKAHEPVSRASRSIPMWLRK
jgi:RNA polymerase sigma-70 factor (ECF subfamily)